MQTSHEAPAWRWVVQSSITTKKHDNINDIFSSEQLKFCKEQSSVSLRIIQHLQKIPAMLTGKNFFRVDYFF